MMTKDEAIHKALKVLNCLNNDRVYETAWVKGAINACEEALEQPAHTTSIDDLISEFEKDPEMKALLDLARKQVNGMKLNPEFDVVHYEQPAQEPVEVYGILDDDDYVSVEATKKGAIKHCEFMNKHDCNCTYKPLYTHPHQWQGLTDDEISQLFLGHTAIDFARAIEQALKEKNHG